MWPIFGPSKFTQSPTAYIPSWSITRMVRSTRTYPKQSMLPMYVAADEPVNGGTSMSRSKFTLCPCLFSQRRIRATGSDDCDFDTLAFATLLEPSCQCKRGFIDRNGQPCSFTQSNDCVTLMKVRNSLTKFNCFVDIEQ